MADPNNPTTAIEAVAEAWASIDGKLDEFVRGKADPAYDMVAGYYMGYCEDAKELIERIQTRGWTVVLKVTG